MQSNKSEKSGDIDSQVEAKEPAGGRVVIIRWILIAAFTLGCLVPLILKYSYGPAQMIDAIQSGLGSRWQGELTVGDCLYNFSRPQYIWQSVSLNDTDNFNWLDVEKLAVGRGNCKNTEINISALKLDVPAEKILSGDVPFRFTSTGAISRDDFKNFNAFLSDTDLAVSWPSAGQTQNENLVARDRVYISNIDSIILSVLWPDKVIGPVWVANDSDAKNIAVGVFNPQTSSFHVESADADEIEFTVERAGQTCTLKLQDLNVDSLDIWPDAVQCGLMSFRLTDSGKISLNGSADRKSGSFELSLNAQQIALESLAPMLGGVATAGKCDYARVKLAKVNANNMAAIGSVEAAFSDVRIGNVGIAGRIMSLLSLSSSDKANIYDIKCELDIEYPKLKVKSCQLSNSVRKLAVQSGSVNLADRTMDLYITLDVLDGGDGVMGAIRSAVGKIMRVHVTGSFDSPKSEFVSEAQNGDASPKAVEAAAETSPETAK